MRSFFFALFKCEATLLDEGSYKLLVSFVLGLSSAGIFHVRSLDWRLLCILSALDSREGTLIGLFVSCFFNFVSLNFAIFVFLHLSSQTLPLSYGSPMVSMSTVASFSRPIKLLVSPLEAGSLPKVKRINHTSCIKLDLIQART